MKHLKRTFCITLALLLGLTGSIFVSAEEESPPVITAELVRQQYAWTSTFIGGGDEGSFLVWHDGELLYEAHARGHSMDGTQAMFSVTKSVLAALTGIALQLGYLDCVEQPVIDFFPEARIAAGQESKRNMTIEHLLTLRSGMPGLNEDSIGSFFNGSINNLFSLRDSGLAAFRTRQLDAPGEMFRYCSGATPQTLVGVLQRATGQNLRRFANEHLFEPLGMTSVRWDTAWDGSPFGGLGIRMSPRDMLTFGQLHLNNGAWDGVQILPEDWVERVQPPYIWGYGYLWWGGQNSLGAFISAQGVGGSIISVYPETNLVVVRTGSHDWWLRIVTWLIRFTAGFFPLFGWWR